MFSLPPKRDSRPSTFGNAGSTSRARAPSASRSSNGTSAAVASSVASRAPLVPSWAAIVQTAIQHLPANLTFTLSVDIGGRVRLGRLEYKWVALTNTTLGMLMATINASILLIALPDIFRGIHIDPLAPGNTSYL